MAIKKHTAKSHAQEFVGSLTVAGRNALRAILAHADGAEQLRAALGVHKQPQLDMHTRRTGLARAGRTIDLFRGVEAVQ